MMSKSILNVGRALARDADNSVYNIANKYNNIQIILSIVNSIKNEIFEEKLQMLKEFRRMGIESGNNGRVKIKLSSIEKIKNEIEELYNTLFFYFIYFVCAYNVVLSYAN